MTIMILKMTTKICTFFLLFSKLKIIKSLFPLNRQASLLYQEIDVIVNYIFPFAFTYISVIIFLLIEIYWTCNSVKV